MLDSNWDLIDGEVAHEIEVLNYSNQVNVIEALVRFLMHHHPGGEKGCAAAPHINVVREFHRTATLFLLEKPGDFREEEVLVKSSSGVIVHEPPTHTEVQLLMEMFFADITRRWSETDAIEMASYALWLINWVHPFKNGNGRTARAFCYACLSLKLGFVLPGSPTVIDLIMQNRRDYQLALKSADIGYGANGQPDLTAMQNFVGRLLVEQLSTVPEPST
jgi:Fic family protein